MMCHAFKILRVSTAHMHTHTSDSPPTPLLQVSRLETQMAGENSRGGARLDAAGQRCEELEAQLAQATQAVAELEAQLTGAEAERALAVTR